MRYRVLKPLSTGQRPGDVIDESALAKYAIAPLVKAKALSPVAYPPVRVLPGWEERAERAERMGVVDVGDLLDADAETLAEGLEATPEEIEELKAEASAAVDITEDEVTRSGCGCSGR